MKSTKKSLVLSTLSLIMCVAMLLGTTYAWFTDSVTSGRNKIIAGNLDIELYAGSTKVDANTKLFTGVTLWEPGAAAYETLTVKNVGTLALKYKMSMLFDNETKVDGHGLSDVLKVGTFEGDVATGATREAVLAQVSSWQALATFTKNGNLSANTNDTPVTYVIYWEPGDNDNLYNMNNGNKGKELSIEFGIELLATQKNEEEDSFDDTYDLNATYENGSSSPIMNVGSAESLKAAIAQFTGGSSIVLDKDIDLKNENWDTTAPWAASGTELVFDGNGHTIKNLKTTSDNGGLFGHLNSNGNITIKNLKIENVDLTGTNVDGESGGGALIGWSEVYGGTLTIENVTVTNVNIKDFKYIGGLVGYTSATNALNIKNCSVNGTELNCTYCEDENNYKGHVGGVIGYYTAGTMSDCSASNLTIKGSTTAKRAGALIGTAQAGAVVGSGNSINNVTINETSVTESTQVIGSVDNRTDKTTNVAIQ